LMYTKNFWNKKHLDYASKKWIDKPTIFAKFAVKYFSRKGKLLDLGSGQGQDSRYFSKLGYKVLASDFSKVALRLLKEKSTNDKLDIETKAVDLGKKLPFNDGSFDIVYSHLALHYFNKKTTTSLFSEVARVTKMGGILAILLNTIEDPQIKHLIKIEKDYYLEPGKLFKRYFSAKSLLDFIDDKFKVLLLDAKGETYKDEIKTLIRFVGEKV